MRRASVNVNCRMRSLEFRRKFSISFLSFSHSCPFPRVPPAADSPVVPPSRDPKARPVAATGAVDEAGDDGKKPAAVELGTQPNSSPTVPVTEIVCILICPKCEARNSDECATCLNCGNTLLGATRISTAGEESTNGHFDKYSRMRKYFGSIHYSKTDLASSICSSRVPVGILKTHCNQTCVKPRTVLSSLQKP